MTALTAIEHWEVDHAAAAVVRGGRVVQSTGDLGAGFALASLSKVLTAVTVMVAVEEGSVGLDDPAGPDGSTVRHLLAHASGLAPDGTEVIAAPATRRIYSNSGFEVLADHVAARTGMPFDDYLRAALVDPLGLVTTEVEGSPAHGHRASVQDLVTVLTAVLDGTLLAPETLSAMTSPVFADLAGVLPGYGRQDPNPWGLGVELRGPKTPHWTAPGCSAGTWGHFGRAGTMIWFDPAAAVGLVVLTDRPFGPWVVEAWPALGTAVLDEAAAASR